MAIWNRNSDPSNAKTNLLSRQVGDMYECVIEAGVNVCYTEHVLSFLCLRTKDNLFLLNSLSFSGSHSEITATLTIKQAQTIIIIMIDT